MKTSRLIPTLIANIPNSSKFVPHWELTFVENEDYGDHYKHESSLYKIYDLIDAYYDTLTKEIVIGKVHEIYPDTTQCKFKIGQKVLVEVENKYRHLQIDVVKDIKFIDYDVEIHTVKEIDQTSCLDHYFCKKDQKDLNRDDVYEFRRYKPYYLLESGILIKWDYKMYHYEE